MLEKYWNCETSLEEERELRRYFVSGGPESRSPEAADLFRYFDAQHQIESSYSSDFGTQSPATAKRQPQRGFRWMYNYGRIAAGLLVVAAAVYFVGQEIRKNHPNESLDTYTDPKVAFEETKKALMMISSGFGKAEKETRKINLLNEAGEKIGNKKEKKENSNI